MQVVDFEVDIVAMFTHIHSFSENYQLRTSRAIKIMNRMSRSGHREVDRVVYDFRLRGVHLSIARVRMFPAGDTPGCAGYCYTTYTPSTSTHYLLHV